MAARSPQAAPFDPPRATAVERRHALRFSGSGSEYFRIWIVNLLLTLVTLGLYYPFAKVRRLRYFYGNTTVAGHAIDFHGSPWRMLRGYLLVGLLFVLYSMASNVSPLAAVVALAAVAAVWPALLHGSLRFRLANTSWRSLRFRFTGKVGDTYRVVLPLFVPAALFVVGAALIPESGEARGAVATLGLVATAFALATSLVFPWFW